MTGDVRLLARLRARSLRSSAAWLFSVMTGSDPARERGVGNRSYQVYVALALAGSVVGLWLFFLDAVQGLSVAYAADVAAFLTVAVGAVPPGVLAVVLALSFVPGW